MVTKDTARSGPGVAQGATGIGLTPRPFAPRPSTGAMYRLHRVLEPGRSWSALARWLEAVPPLYRAFAWVEGLVKGWLFGCRMCGQCALPVTAYACPQTCPKQLRNGPCGGVSPDGFCEVYPDRRCVWVVAYERAERAGRVVDLHRLVRPLDHRKWGSSSWVNYWLGRDAHLWTAEAAPSTDELPVVAVRTA